MCPSNSFVIAGGTNGNERAPWRGRPGGGEERGEPRVVRELDRARARGDQDRVRRRLHDQTVTLGERVEFRDVVDRHHRTARGVRRRDNVEDLPRPRLARTVPRPTWRRTIAVPSGSCSSSSRGSRRSTAKSARPMSGSPLSRPENKASRALCRVMNPSPSSTAMPPAIASNAALSSRGVARLLVEARIHHRQRELRREAFRDAGVFVGEVIVAVGNAQHADRSIGRRKQRRCDDLADRSHHARVRS